MNELGMAAESCDDQNVEPPHAPLPPARGIPSSVPRASGQKAAEPAIGVPSRRPELVFALIAAVGTDLEALETVLEQSLNGVGYTGRRVRLTDQLREIAWVSIRPTSKADERYEALMDAGNDFRDKAGTNEAFGLLAVSAIREIRQTITGSFEEPAYDNAYIVRQLKHPDEISRLRRVYGSHLIVVAAHSPRHKRVDDLAARIAESEHVARAEEYRYRAEKIISRDQEETGPDGTKLKHGQRLRDCFPLADVFVNAGNVTRLRADIDRLIRIVFGYRYHTPTREEEGMFLARAAALRSASMGRQVGAAICTSGGEVLTLGTNEVPRYGGGEVWEGDAEDDRDFRLNRDLSDQYRRSLVADTINRLSTAGWLVPSYATKTIDELVATALHGRQNGQPPGPLRSGRVMDVMEFVRAMHAEMAAISGAARLGRSLKDAILYVTTFPCHECARLIVGTGIQRVVFIEPYAKSLAYELYPSSIAVEREEPNKLPFVHYIGVAPRRYSEWFEALDRKTDEGNAIPWVPAIAQPRMLRGEPVYLQSEKLADSELFEINKRNSGILP